MKLAGHLDPKRAALSVALLISGLAQADFTPLILNTNSFNQDVVVEKGAPAAPLPVTTASMDDGTINTAYSWYEIGYNLESPETGLPVAGSTVSNEAADHSYTLAASFATSNAILIDASATNATFTVTTPASYGALSFLTSAGSGTVTVAFTVHHADGSTNAGTFVSPDWFNGENVVVTASGRVNVVSRAFDNVGNNNPRLYSVDVTIPVATSAITRIDLAYSSGGGHAAIFAVSGSTGAGFAPIAVSGYTQDLIVEAGSPQPIGPLEVTTATMDEGITNTGFTWYEAGYNALALLTGLPAAGTTLTNATSPDHIYYLAPSYTNNNVALVDADNPSVSLTLATPTSQSALSFLTSAGGGAVTIDFVLTHADATTQSGSFIAPDWFNNTPVAFASRGRVNVDGGGVDSVNTENPRLYSVDLAVQNTSSPITQIALNHQTGTGHAAIFAVSGATGSVQPIVEAQPTSVNAYVGSNVEFAATVSGNLPLSFRWQKEAGGTFVDLADGGNISGATTATLKLNATVFANAGNYRLSVTNAAGSANSQVASLTLLSTATDVTSPEDEIVTFDGTSPGAEAVGMAIDGTTSKYLNFGIDPAAAPFVGPVGLIVTPVLGSTIVTGVRVFTANDAVERDPIDFKLEGSNDGGGTFATIAEGALDLPAGRNASGQPIDPLTQVLQEVLFTNGAAYATYRLSFAHVKDDTSANSMQVAEIELLGTTAAGIPQVSVGTNAAGEVILTFTGTLQSAPTLGGTFTSVSGAVAPTYTVPSGDAAGQQFYRASN